MVVLRGQQSYCPKVGFCFFPPTLSSCLSLPSLNYFPKNTFWKFSLSSTPLTQFSTITIPQYPFSYQFIFSNANVAFANTTLQVLVIFLSLAFYFAIPACFIYWLTVFFLHSSFHRLYIIVVFLLCFPFPPSFLSLAFFLLSLLCFSFYFLSFFFCLHFWLFLFFSIIHSQWETLASYTVWCCPCSTRHPSTDRLTSAVGGVGC